VLNGVPLLVLALLPLLSSQALGGEEEELLLDQIASFAGRCPGWGTDGFWWRFSVYMDDDPVRKVAAFMLVAEDRYVSVLGGSTVPGEVEFVAGSPGQAVFSPDSAFAPAWLLSLDDPISYEYAITGGGRVLTLCYTGDDGCLVREVFERKDPSMLIDYLAGPELLEYLETCAEIIP
jgi:hypothetical protein